MDGMRKVPPGTFQIRNMLRRASAKAADTRCPTRSAPPRQLGHHHNAMLRRFLDTFGFDYEFYSATEFYASGAFDDILLRAAER